MVDEKFLNGNIINYAKVVKGEGVLKWKTFMSMEKNRSFKRQFFCHF